MESEGPVFAGIEGGGTTCVVAIAKGRTDNIVERHVVDTTEPAETVQKLVDWLKSRPFDALGIACFGPLQLDASSPTYGYITTTPKPKWGNTDFLGNFRQFNKPVGFDTDVNGAAIAQAVAGKHRSCAYVTIGTGIGVGIVSEERPVHGLLHPEMGHIHVLRSEGDTYPDDKETLGCPYHKKNCLEGLIATGALTGRFKVHHSQLPSIPDEHPEWLHVAFYLAQLCATLVLTLCPEVIVLGGGVMARKSLFPLIRKKTLEILNGYIQLPAITERIDEYIIPSPFGGNAGMVGAMELAKAALEKSQSQ